MKDKAKKIFSSDTRDKMKANRLFELCGDLNLEIEALKAKVKELSRHKSSLEIIKKAIKGSRILKVNGQPYYHGGDLVK